MGVEGLILRSVLVLAFKYAPRGTPKEENDPASKRYNDVLTHSWIMQVPSLWTLRLTPLRHSGDRVLMQVIHLCFAVWVYCERNDPPLSLDTLAYGEFGGKRNIHPGYR